jgi:tellurite resistance protein
MAVCAVLAVASDKCRCEERGRETRHLFESQQTVRKAITKVSDIVEKEGLANVTLQSRISEREKRIFSFFVIEKQITVT